MGQGGGMGRYRIVVLSSGSRCQRPWACGSAGSAAARACVYFIVPSPPGRVDQTVYARTSRVPAPLIQGGACVCLSACLPVGSRSRLRVRSCVCLLSSAFHSAGWIGSSEARRSRRRRSSSPSAAARSRSPKHTSLSSYTCVRACVRVRACVLFAWVQQESKHKKFCFVAIIGVLQVAPPGRVMREREGTSSEGQDEGARGKGRE